MGIVVSGKSAVKSLFWQGVVIALCLYIIDTHPSLVVTSSALLMWLPHGLLTAAALMAMQFGHSRLCIAALVMLVCLMLPWIPIPWLMSLPVQGALPALLMVTMISLLWDRDRGLSLFGIVSSLAVIAASYGLFLVLEFAVTQISSLSDSALAQWWVQNGASHIAFSHLLITLVAIGCGIIRILMQPTNRHNALLFVALFITSVNWYFAKQYPLLVFSTVAVAFLVLILLDSYNMAFKDELTGINGRRALMQYVGTLGKKYVVVMGDVDKFKKFNDKYGHDVGDQVLKMVAICLDNVGGGGRAFRYGGEEFTLIFANKTIKQAQIYVEEVRIAIESRAFQIRSPSRAKSTAEQRGNKAKEHISNVYVTSSFGLAERSASNNEFAKVMKAADKALYKAKAAGRNCIHSG